MKRIILLLLFISLIFASFVDIAISSESVKLITEDQKQIYATYYPPPSDNAPGVIFIPDARCDGILFGGRFPSNLNNAGFAVLY
ncbi:MAG: hypothetical protein QME83_11550 [Thermodesulfobacteriota bacterium]|nr:hypothetical protein [Thermodesulfobacteriota bacterium]